MTRNPQGTADSYRCIDRRALLGIIGSGVAGVSGCLSGSSSDDNTDPSSETEEGDEETETEEAMWLPPEESSQYIESTSFTIGDSGGSLYLDFELADITEYDDISIVGPSGQEFDSASISDGETFAQVELVTGVAAGLSSEAIDKGESTIIVSSDDGQAEVPFTLSTSTTFQELVTSGNSDELQDNELGISVENTGPHTDVIFRREVTNAPADGSQGMFSSSWELSDNLILVEPGQTAMATIPGHVWRASDCEEYDQRSLELTAVSAWSDDVTISQSVRYDSAGICGSLEGEAEPTQASEGGTS
jgi:hypothetical protein